MTTNERLHPSKSGQIREDDWLNPQAVDQLKFLRGKQRPARRPTTSHRLDRRHEHDLVIHGVEYGGVVHPMTTPFSIRILRQRGSFACRTSSDCLAGSFDDATKQ